MNSINLPIFLALLLLAPLDPVEAQTVNQSDFLGSQKLNEKSKRGNVRVSRSTQTYAGIQIEIVGTGDVVKRATVQFEDRSRESFSDSHLKTSNRRTAVIWFRSGRQVIDKVSLLYDPDVAIGEGAEIRIYGVR